MKVDQPPVRRGRWQLLGLLLVCALPVLASYFTYYVVRPDGRRNFGVLISPSLALPQGVSGRTLEGREVPLEGLRGQWLLVSVDSGACDVRCEKKLYMQRQLRESLGKEKERVDWIWLVTDSAELPLALRPGLTQATVLRVPAAPVQAWLQAEPGASLRDHLFVVDPHGQWMMRFPGGMDLGQASKAKRDLDRLLRASAFWDQAGRGR